MANLIGGHTEGIDMGDWNQWGFDTLLNSTGSLFEYETPDGHRVQITGSDFVYGKGGMPIGSTVILAGIQSNALDSSEFLF